MIDIRDIKTRYDEIQRNIETRYMNVDLKKIAEDMDKRSALLQKTEALRAKRNETAAKMKGKLDPETIDESVFESYLDTHGIPDPDLMIRTSGEQRLSNYLLWQLAYSEFYFTDVPWPDFTKDELVKAVEEYNHRHRRFGRVEEG